jgi:hypothetical protein
MWIGFERIGDAVFAPDGYGRDLDSEELAFLDRFAVGDFHHRPKRNSRLVISHERRYPVLAAVAVMS